MYGIDTNILVYMFDAASVYQSESKMFIAESLKKEKIAIAEFTLFEFYSVITDGRKVKTPLAPFEAGAIIQDFYESEGFEVFSLLEENLYNMFSYAKENNIKRNDVYDLKIAYTLKTNGIKTIYTANTKDFKKFKFISVVNPFTTSKISQANKPKTIPYSRQSIDEKDIASVCSALRSDWLTQGSKIKEFEGLLANYCGAKFAVAVSSGTAALHAAYFAAGISPGDEVITSPITFAATANAAIYMGARPVFVDVEPDTGNIDTRKIQSAITAKTKAIVPVHFGGHPSDMEQIHSIADKNRLIVIEDACHALGAQHKIKDNDGNEKWVKVGSCTHSDMAIFSFHPVKPITTGEGGAVLTNNEDFYKKLLMFRSHGITRTDFVNEPHGEWYYEMQCMGYNYRMTDIHAALGISQLNKLDSFIRARRNIRDIYNKEFAENPYIDLPVEKDYVNSSLHLYAVKLKGKYIGQKTNIFERLKEKGLGVQVHYIPVYLHPFYKKTGYDEGICPDAELFYKRQLSIPLHHGLSETDALRLTKIVIEAFKK